METGTFSFSLIAVEVSNELTFFYLLNFSIGDSQPSNINHVEHKVLAATHFPTSSFLEITRQTL